MLILNLNFEDDRWFEDNVLFDDDDEELGYLRRRNLIVVYISGAIILGKRSRISRRERRSGHLVHANLQPEPRIKSAWQSLLKSNDNRASITTMSLDIDTFDYLLSAGFCDAWNMTAIPRSNVNTAGLSRLGRRSLDAEDALGLLLHHLCSTMNETALQLIFAIVPSVLSRYIDFGLDILLAVLKDIPEATISWPTPAKMRVYSDAIQEHHPTISGVFGFMDGLGVPVGVSGTRLWRMQTTMDGRSVKRSPLLLCLRRTVCTAY